MKTIKITEPWVPDQDTYNQIQKLQKFAIFLSNLAIATKEQKNKILEIKQILKSFNEPGIKKQFFMGLDIFHRDHYEYVNDLELPIDDVDGYWRRWYVDFELNALEIVVETEATGTDAEIYEKEPFYSAAIYFEKKLMPRRVYLDTPIEEFLKDAFNYKKYISEIHNEIEIDVDIW